MPRRIVGLTGYAGAGKSTIAEYFRIRAGFTTGSFATPIKMKCDPILIRMGIDPSSPDGKVKCRPAYVCQGELKREECPTYWIDRLAEILPADEDVIIDDVRYCNEGEWIHKQGGLLLYVQRPNIQPANGVEYESVSRLRSIFDPKIIDNNEPNRIIHAIHQAQTAIYWHYTHR